MALLVRLEKKSGEFSHSRDPLPYELAELGVPQNVWRDTVDDFVGWYEWTANNGGVARSAVYTRGSDSNVLNLLNIGFFCIVLGAILFFTPLVVAGTLFVIWDCLVGSFCVQPNQSVITGGGADTFGYFLNQQQRKYSNYGVRVKRGGPRDFPKLVFYEDNYDTHEEQDQHLTKASSSSLARDLQSLDTLHQSGALADEEYARAKERVMLKSANVSNVTKSDESTGLMTSDEAESEGFVDKIV